MRVIIRRPHAYKIRAKYPEAKIPGFLVLDAKGKSLGVVPLPNEKAAKKLQSLLGR